MPGHPWHVAFFMEIIMIRTRLLALPIMGAIALTTLSGCATDPLLNIPANATVASSGNGSLWGPVRINHAIVSCER